jgi:hypothetical protein
MHSPVMSPRKKVLLVVGAFGALIATYLLSFSLISTSHPISKAAIHQSPEVAKSVGKPTGMLLLANSQKLVPGGNSCSTNTYLVFGDDGWTVVVSELSMRGGQSDWSVDNLSLGWFGGSSRSC